MIKVKNTNYVSIQGWMVTDLHLKGNDLIIYAIIYGFTQDGEQWFEGSRQYLAEWCNSTTRGVSKNLNSLVKKGYLIKEDVVINNVKFCKYKANINCSLVGNKVHIGEEQSSPPPREQSSPPPREQSSPNNLDNNINIYNNIVNNRACAKEDIQQLDKDKVAEAIKIVAEACRLIDDKRGTSFKDEPNDNVKRFVLEWLVEGYTHEQMIQVVKYALENWDVKINISPMLLFRPDKFKRYFELSKRFEKISKKKSDNYGSLDISEYESYDMFADDDVSSPQSSVNDKLVFSGKWVNSKYCNETNTLKVVDKTPSVKSDNKILDKCQKLAFRIIDAINEETNNRFVSSKLLEEIIQFKLNEGNTENEIFKDIMDKGSSLHELIIDYLSAGL